MNAAAIHPLARDYLKRLRKAARRLPRARRAELLEEIEAHLREALPPGASEADARDVLERLGEPEQIVAEAASAGPRAGWQEWATIPLLLVGGLLAVVGWLIGLVLLWSSRFWTIRDKLIGTLVLPGGLLPFVFFWMAPAGTCSGSSGTRINPKTGRAEPFTTSDCPHYSAAHTGLMIALTIALIVLPILTSIYLARRANRADLVAT